MLLPNGGNIATEFYAENLAQDAISQSQAYTNLAIDDHLTVGNPHDITPSLINAYSTQWQSLDLPLAVGWNHYREAWRPWINFNENLVHLSGLVKPSDNASNIICQLNPIFYPRHKMMSLCFYNQSGSTKITRVDIDTNGVVNVHGITMNDIFWLMLPNTFYVSQR